MNGITPIDFGLPGTQSMDCTVLPHDSLQIVRELTKSSCNTFACLKVYNRKCSKIQEERLVGVGMRIFQQQVAEQSNVYANTINASLVVAEKGAIIARNAMMMLDDDYVFTPTMLASMTKDVSEILRHAIDIEKTFRGIRAAIYQAQDILPSNTQVPCNLDVTTKINVQALERMGDDQLVDLASAVITQLVLVVGKFVDWWSQIQTEGIRLSALVRDDRSAARGVWAGLEQQYLVYSREVKDQQDYYIMFPQSDSTGVC